MKPDRRVFAEPSPRRVRVSFGGRIIADSTNMLLLHEEGNVPVYYFPRADVSMARLAATDHATRCPRKGEARYWTVRTDGREAGNAARSYESPPHDLANIAGHIVFDWDAMDHWYEEDEEVFVHARDPYTRIDVLASRRPVEVILGGRTVARTKRARFLFETGLPVRHYVWRADVRSELLERSERRTRCPYKGEAVYWHARIDGRRWEDVVWSYPDPLPECAKIRGLMCFYGEKVDELRVDGEAVPKPETRWKRD